MPAAQRFFDDMIDKEWGDLTVRHEIGVEIANQCHSKAGLAIRYFGGMLVVVCHKCHSHIIDVQVKEA